MANGAPRAHHGDTDAHRHPALDHAQAIDPAVPRCRSRLMAGAAPCLAVARAGGRPSRLPGPAGNRPDGREGLRYAVTAHESVSYRVLRHSARKAWRWRNTT